MQAFNLFIPVNPVPWAVGPLSVGRKSNKPYPMMGRNTAVYDFQQEVKEWCADKELYIMLTEVDLYFYFWQRLEQYRSDGSGRLVTKKPADATNMQKATEDALQGILYFNDKQVKKIGSEIVAQGTDIPGGIGIIYRSYDPVNDDIQLPDWLAEKRLAQERVVRSPGFSSNVWPPPAGM